MPLAWAVPELNFSEATWRVPLKFNWSLAPLLMLSAPLPSETALEQARVPPVTLVVPV